MGQSVTKLGLPVGPIPDLPTEILLTIFANFQKKELLKCRLVCDRWKQIATPVCRELDTNLKPFTEINNLKDLFQIVLNEDSDAPWSSSLLFLESNPVVAFPVKENGKKFMELNVIGNYTQLLLNELKKSSNLSKLTICLFPHEVRRRLQSGSDITLKYALPFLSSADDLDVEMDEEEKALEILLKNVGQLELTPVTQLSTIYLLEEILYHRRLSLKRLQLNYREDLHLRRLVQGVIGLMSPNPSISLHLLYHKQAMFYISKTFAARRVTLRKLHVKMKHPDESQDFDCDPRGLTNFLEMNSSHLEKVHIHPYKEKGNNYISKLQFQVPALPTLKCLKFTTEKRESGIDPRRLNPPFGFPNILPFKGEQFPVLKKVELMEMNPVLEAFDHDVFHTVEVLVLMGNGRRPPTLTDGKWNRIFPNLTSLEAEVDVANTYYILRQMKKLIELTLWMILPLVADPWIGPGCSDDENINFLLSGIHEHFSTARKSDEEIQTIIGGRRSPSLLDMQDLKRLKIIFFGETCEDCETKPFNDSGAILSVLPLPPLDFLSLTGARISERCKARLRGHHTRCEFPEMSFDDSKDFCSSFPRCAHHH